VTLAKAAVTSSRSPLWLRHDSVDTKTDSRYGSVMTPWILKRTPVMVPSFLNYVQARSILDPRTVYFLEKYTGAPGASGAGGDCPGCAFGAPGAEGASNAFGDRILHLKLPTPTSECSMIPQPSTSFHFFMCCRALA
jgi:hypothetical protein